MSSIVELMLKKDPFVFSGKVTETQITEAEKKLGVQFSDDYREYLLAFGTASYYGHELTGISENDSTINVVDVTLLERNHFAEIPKGWYVIEQTHIDGIVIWQDEKGTIYQVTPHSHKIIYRSLKEYVTSE